MFSYATIHNLKSGRMGGGYVRVEAGPYHAVWVHPESGHTWRIEVDFQDKQHRLIRVVRDGRISNNGNVTEQCIRLLYDPVTKYFHTNRELLQSNDIWRRPVTSSLDNPPRHSGTHQPAGNNGKKKAVPAKFQKRWSY